MTHCCSGSNFFGSPVEFTFVNAVPAGPFEIQTGANVADNTKQTVEGWFGQLMFVRSSNTLTLNTGVGQVFYFDSGFNDGGVTFNGTLTLPAISIDASMNASEVALAIRQGLADVYAAGDVITLRAMKI